MYMKKTILFLILILIIGVGVYLLKKSNPKKQTVVDYPITDTQQIKDIGTILSNKNGMTLYVKKENPESEKSCDYKCKVFWKPFIANSNIAQDSDFSNKYNFGNKITLVKRNDGLYQYAFDNKLLYTFIGDIKPGDIKGLTFKDKDWDLIKL